MSTYVLDNAAVQTHDRFAALELYDPWCQRQLTALGVAPGWRCLEVGAGSGSLANWLADRVGSTGSVVATDIDTSLFRPAHRNIELWQHDIVDDELPEAAFDLVHARLVLLHLPERNRVLRRIWRALKPGGVLLLDEFDCRWLPVLAAPSPADSVLFTKVVGGIHHLLAEAGADLAWGSNAYAAMAETGYVDLTVRGHCEQWVGGSVGAHLHRANVLQTREKLIGAGLVEAEEIETFLRLLDHPRFAVSSYLMLSTAGCGGSPSRRG